MYFAHLSEDKLRSQTVLEHLRGTAKLAGEFAEEFNCKDWGCGCGLMHDIGKYSDKFQKRLNGGSITDHATAGAAELFRRKNYIGAYCISGHHSGLLNGGSPADGGGDATLMGRMKKQLEDYRAFQSEIGIPEFTNPPLRPLEKGGFSLAFFIRVLFSCLVDADYLDTEAFMSEGKVKRGGCSTMKELSDKLSSYISPWINSAEQDTVNGRRTSILRACREQGNSPQGLFQLTVPTGGGKTVSSLAFALRHAVEHNLKRIIYVIPYTSIIEQNAGVFKDILGSQNVLEDHCNVTYDNQEELIHSQLAAENWDRPVVVTTNVQFFESLFSNKPSKCRKLHNIAKSVIIFDEAQMLPNKYLQPCIRSIGELIYNYHCSAVICTATQPALLQFFPTQINAKELCPDVRDQYEFFRRTSFEKLGEITEEVLEEHIRSHSQALCILNSRKRVQKLYKALADEDGVYHLSTLMYPEHRKRVLDEIRNRLKVEEPCRVIATSLVEAGVDLDFPAVYRETAGLDSVIQAAGRCNREGKWLKEECSTYVFTLEKTDDIHIPTELKLPVSVADQIIRNYEDIASLEAIDEYFRRLYYYKGESLDSKDIVGQMERAARSLLFPFEDIAHQFKIIESNTKTILIDKEEPAAAIAVRIRRGEHSRQLIRDAGLYCVNVYEKDFENLMGAGRLEQLDTEFCLLRNKEQYTEESGLIIDVSRGEAVVF